MSIQLLHVRQRGRQRRHTVRWVGSQTGSVTAEFVAVVPAVLLVLGCCLGGMQLATVQARLQDAAATAARSAARGETVLASSLVSGANTTLARRGNLLCAIVTRDGTAVSGILGAMTLTATSCTLVESQ